MHRSLLRHDQPNDACRYVEVYPFFPLHWPFTALYHDHNYFGLAPEQVVFFSQGTLPCMDDDGHIILSSRSEVSILPPSYDQIATAPDGNGGLYMGLYKSAITVNGVEDASRCVLDDMVAKGVKFVQIYGVDNAFVRVGVSLVM